MSGGVPPAYAGLIDKSARLTQQSNIASTGELASFTSYIFLDQDDKAISTRGIASVQRLPLFGIKEVVGGYPEPFETFIAFPLSVGARWTYGSPVKVAIRTPGGSAVLTTIGCSAQSEREIVDAGEIALQVDEQVRLVPSLVMHEVGKVTCLGQTKLSHVYYWINEQLGIVAYVAGVQGVDVAVFDHAAFIASLIRVEG